MFHDLPENDPNISTDELTLLKRETKQTTSAVRLNLLVNYKYIMSEECFVALDNLILDSVVRVTRKNGHTGIQKYTSENRISML